MGIIKRVHKIESEYDPRFAEELKLRAELRRQYKEEQVRKKVEEEYLKKQAEIGPNEGRKSKKNTSDNRSYCELVKLMPERASELLISMNKTSDKSSSDSENVTEESEGFD